MVLMPIGLVLSVFALALVIGIAKDGSPLCRDFWTS